MVLLSLDFVVRGTFSCIMKGNISGPYWRPSERHDIINLQL